MVLSASYWTREEAGAHLHCTVYFENEEILTLLLKDNHRINHTNLALQCFYLKFIYGIRLLLPLFRNGSLGVRMGVFGLLITVVKLEQYGKYKGLSR